MANVSALGASDFGAQLHRARGFVRDFEEPDGQPNVEYVTTRCHVIEYLGEQLIAKVRMRDAVATSFEKPFAGINGVGPEQGVVYARAWELRVRCFTVSRGQA